MIYFEEDILDETTRAKIIKQIEGTENYRRKLKIYTREEIYNDKVYKYVIDALRETLKEKTILAMQNSISNINILKKIIDKLARVYTYGVERSTTSEEYQTNLDNLMDKIDFDTKMKQSNRQYRRDYNCALYARPMKIQNSPDDAPKYYGDLEVLAPYLYDVIEDPENRHRPICYILSNFDIRSSSKYTTMDAAYAGRTASINDSVDNPSDGIDQLIADRKEDAGKGKAKQYVFWTGNYHFTTNRVGEIISGEDITNPIMELPFVELSAKNVNNFWSDGGDDLVQGTILINSLLSHINNIGITQGYGQFYAMGSKLPRQFEFGPNKALLFEYTKEDVKPEVGFATANPNLDSLMGVIETYTALLLSTRNLSTSAVRMSLDGGMSAPSGVAMMLDKAESTEDVEDQRSMFVYADPLIVSKINKWNVYFATNNMIDERFIDATFPEDEDVIIRFNRAGAILTEGEKLDIIQKRKDLGINTKLDLIMIDNPDMTMEQAEEKLLTIQEEKAKNLLSTFPQAQPIAPTREEEEEDDDENNVDE